MIDWLRWMLFGKPARYRTIPTISKPAPLTPPKQEPMIENRIWINPEAQIEVGTYQALACPDCNSAIKYPPPRFCSCGLNLSLVSKLTKKDFPLFATKKVCPCCNKPEFEEIVVWNVEDKLNNGYWHYSKYECKICGHRWTIGVNHKYGETGRDSIS